ncbi:MAG: hypothetical protein COV76_00950 [Candidatus Omnitrophica bacterium CG11_big_fil_rev_8_21_14_0_20_64_10]|nr:MAG: hypothetical protein COV76_00950 [Candidatus Omnitrophica bacterium CG11_big_fil_rev_8_21_14_0_20_64_10]
MSISNSSLFALIKLLADDQPPIADAARAKLIQLGERAIPFLEQARRADAEQAVRFEAGQLLNQMRVERLNRLWERNAALSDDHLDLEHSVFLLAQIDHPGLDIEAYRSRLDRLADRVRVGFKPRQTLLRRFRLLNQVLFASEGFRGNWADTGDPKNLYMHHLLDRRIGAPVTLSALMLLLARRLDLPLDGIALPGHFMVRAPEITPELYIDPFHNGRFLSRGECIQSLVESGFPYQPEFLRPVRVREILGRMLRNLILIHAERQEAGVEERLEFFLDILGS